MRQLCHCAWCGDYQLVPAGGFLGWIERSRRASKRSLLLSGLAYAGAVWATGTGGTVTAGGGFSLNGVLL
ncbi:unnamed protein product [Lampetra planeri]